LLVSRLISSSTGGMPESSWRVLLLMYHGALRTMRSILDCADVRLRTPDDQQKGRPKHVES
jgi:hypothetical protein